MKHNKKASMYLAKYAGSQKKKKYIKAFFYELMYKLHRRKAVRRKIDESRKVN